MLIVKQVQSGESMTIWNPENIERTHKAFIEELMKVDETTNQHTN